MPCMGIKQQLDKIRSFADEQKGATAVKHIRTGFCTQDVFLEALEHAIRLPRSMTMAS